MFRVQAPETGMHSVPETVNVSPYAGSKLGELSDDMRERTLAMLSRDLGWDREDGELDAQEAR